MSKQPDIIVPNVFPLLTSGAETVTFKITGVNDGGGIHNTLCYLEVIECDKPEYIGFTTQVTPRSLMITALPKNEIHGMLQQDAKLYVTFSSLGERTGPVINKIEYEDKTWRKT